MLVFFNNSFISSYSEGYLSWYLLGLIPILFKYSSIVSSTTSVIGSVSITGSSSVTSVSSTGWFNTDKSISSVFLI